MSKKPSLTKQIAELLETDDKREQLKRIEELKTTAFSPVVSVTVLYARGNVRLSVVGTGDVTADDLKFILQKAIDEITAQVVRQQLQQEQGQDEPDPKMPEGPRQDVDPDEDKQYSPLPETDEPVGPQAGDVLANGDMTP